MYVRMYLYVQSQVYIGFSAIHGFRLLPEVVPAELTQGGSCTLLTGHFGE